MKTCTKCRIEKPLSDFALRNKTLGKYASNCKQCQKVMKDNHYKKYSKVYKKKAKVYDAKQRQRWQEFKHTLKCEKCGEDRAPTLDFHHPEDNKENSVANLVNGRYGWDLIMAEVQKCIVLCSNCHRMLHYERRSSSG